MNDSQAIFSQRDPRWSRQKIGPSVITIGGYGCTLTSTCRSLFLLTGKLLTPSQMEDSIRFTSQGLIRWETFDRVGLKAYRFRNQKPKAFKKGMLIELDYNPRHWVCFEKDNGNGTIEVMDPWVGKIVTKKVSEICGFTYIDSTDEERELTEYEKEAIEAKKFVMQHKLSNGERPQDPITRGEIWVIIVRVIKLIKNWAQNDWK